MDTALLIVIAVVLLAAVGALAFVAGRKRRTLRLRERFGPEYDRAVRETGDRQGAEAELERRERRHEKLQLRPLDRAAAERYQSAWRDTQSHFVDEPSAAIRDADHLITAVMRERGYPMDNFDQRASDLSVEHPEVVSEYRAAHRVATANERGQASTEDLREAMIHYRSLFDQLIDTGHRTREGYR